MGQVDLPARADTHSTMLAFHCAFLTINRYGSGRESVSPSYCFFKNLSVHCDVCCRIRLEELIFMRALNFIETTYWRYRTIFFPFDEPYSRRRSHFIAPSECGRVGNTGNTLSRESLYGRFTVVVDGILAHSRRKAPRCKAACKYTLCTCIDIYFYKY